jgi:hypothetical protein
LDFGAGERDVGFEFLFAGGADERHVHRGLAVKVCVIGIRGGL